MSEILTIEQKPNIGDRVIATMDGKTFFHGEFVKEEEIFAPYGVLVDGSKEVRFFISAEKEDGR